MPAPSAQAVKAFNRMVSFKPAEARRFVRECLAEFGESFPRSDIVSELLDHPDGNVRLAAIEALRAA